MVAALGDLQVGVMPRRQLHSLRRNEIEKRLVRRRQVFVNGGHDFFVALRTGDLQHLRMPVENLLRLGAEAAGHDDLAVFRQGLPDRFQRLVHGRVDESAGVHDHEIGLAVGGGDFIALGAQAGQNALGIHQSLRAAQTHEAHFGALANDGFQRMIDLARGAGILLQNPQFAPGYPPRAAPRPSRGGISPRAAPGPAGPRSRRARPPPRRWPPPNRPAGAGGIGAGSRTTASRIRSPASASRCRTGS